MKKILYFNLLFFLFCGLVMPLSAKRKKKEVVQKTEIRTPYQKFFDGKKCETKAGFMKVHRINGKVYVEFPVRFLGKDMLYTSSIENISDNGEGVVGQFAGAGVLFRFSKLDSVLQASVVKNLPFDSGENEVLSGALQESNTGGVYVSFKIEAVNPKDSAFLVDMTPLFLESSYHTNPFSSFGGNSLFGFVSRVHNYRPERSFLKDVEVRDWDIDVRCEQSYDVDRLIFGSFLMHKGVPVSITVNKMLMALPEQPMRPRLADPRIGVLPVRKADFSKADEGVKQIYFSKRWRIELVDEVAHRAGKLVEPRQPIVFYLDSLMPECWKPYVKAGGEVWNQAFEKIGFKNVIRVDDFPVNDPNFDANDIRHSTIRFSPSVLWMTIAQTSMHEDPRSGEILNASIYVHNNLVQAMLKNRMAATMAADPSVRRIYLSDAEVGDMLKVYITRAVGKCLGLADNFGASSAYPIDSLRSASFTQKYGLTPSVMDDLTYNYIAQPEDVQKGVRLTPKGLGTYDYYAIKWLYQPIYDLKDFREELSTLDGWIKESLKDPYCRYGKKQIAFPVYDPFVVSGDLGDDHVKAMGYLVKNAKVGMKHLNEWYSDHDANLRERAELCQYMEMLLSSRIRDVANNIGGFYLRDVRNGDGRATYEIVPREKQRAAVKCLLDLTTDFSWLDEAAIIEELEIQDGKADMMRQLVISCLFERMKPVALCTEKSDRAYSIREYVADLYRWVWEGTLNNRELTPSEINVQRAFLTSVIKTSTVDATPAILTASGKVGWVSRENNLPAELFCKAALTRMLEKGVNPERGGGYPMGMVYQNDYPVASIYYRMLLDIQALLKNKIEQSSGTTRQHYDYLLFKIKRAVDHNR